MAPINGRGSGEERIGNGRRFPSRESGERREMPLLVPKYERPRRGRAAGPLISTELFLFFIFFFFLSTKNINKYILKYLYKIIIVIQKLFIIKIIIVLDQCFYIN
jgi:hypothetical protein